MTDVNRTRRWLGRHWPGLLLVVPFALAIHADPVGAVVVFLFVTMVWDGVAEAGRVYGWWRRD